MNDYRGFNLSFSPPAADQQHRMRMAIMKSISSRVTVNSG
jgi:hypothetical protein